MESLFNQKTLPKNENELILDFINDDAKKKSFNKSFSNKKSGSLVKTKVLDDMSNWQATGEINEISEEFGATNVSFKTCKSINEIVNDIDVQTFDDFEMSKRINNDKSNNNLKMTPSTTTVKKDNNSQSLKVVKNDDIDFDEVEDYNQSPYLKKVNSDFYGVNLKNKYNQPAVTSFDTIDNISEIEKIS